MAKDHRTTAAEEAWGTLEELLLACAVNRHGTKSWDSIAMEVQNRSSSFPSLTSQHCIDKFNDLKRRYKPPLGDASAGLVAIIDALRKTRVEELRREVQERDVSILSLESKVKKLEEERERSAKEDADLAGEKKLNLDTVTGKAAGGGEESADERENRSFNESNSTDQQKAEATTARLQNDAVDGGPTAQPDPQIKNENEPGGSGSDPRATRDWSCNGKSEDVDDDGDNGKPGTAVKESRFKSSHTTGGLGESNELGESVGESKREEKEKEKQNSDVQSSASLSLKTKKRRHRVVRRGGGGASSSGDSGGGVASSSAEEQDAGDEISPATKRAKGAVKSEPVIKLIETIRSHRLGSVFELRLRSQESQRYKNLIRQHIDLQTIQSRLDNGIYSSSLHKFFRDILLLFNNGVVFFKKNSPENSAACELRALVLKEMAKKIGKRKIQTTKPKPETKQPSSFSKPNKSSTIVACGKGNSSKVATETASKKGSSSDKKDKEVEEKTKANPKKIEPSFPKIEDKTTIRKKRTKDQRSVATNRNTTTTTTKNTDTKHKFGGNELSSHDALETKVEKKGNSNTSKRQGAASFLKRMKQNSPSQANDDESSEEETQEVEEEEEEEVEKEESKGKEEKGKKGGKSGNKEGNITERVTRSSKGRNVKGESGRGKRTVGRGRPPKKESPAAETPTPAGKRGRDSGGGDGGSGGGRAKKRTRR